MTPSLTEEQLVDMLEDADVLSWRSYEAVRLLVAEVRRLRALAFAEYHRGKESRHISHAECNSLANGLRMQRDDAMAALEIPTDTTAFLTHLRLRLVRQRRELHALAKVLDWYRHSMGLWHGEAESMRADLARVTAERDVAREAVEAARALVDAPTSDELGGESNVWTKEEIRAGQALTRALAKYDEGMATK